MNLTRYRKLVDSSRQDTDETAFASIPPSSAASSTTPARSTKLNCFETKDDKGRPVRFGSVGGGGRYDGLVSRFRGEPVPATGFSIGVSRLQAALDRARQARLRNRRPARWWSRCSAPTACRATRSSPRRCATPTSAPSFISAIRNTASAQQLKYADKRGSPCAVIQGGDEKAKGEVQIKDLIVGVGAERHQGPRRISEEAGRGAVRGQGRRAGRGSAQAARAP